MRTERRVKETILRGLSTCAIDKWEERSRIKNLKGRHFTYTRIKGEVLKGLLDLTLVLQIF